MCIDFLIVFYVAPASNCSTFPIILLVSRFEVTLGRFLCKKNASGMFT